MVDEEAMRSGRGAKILYGDNALEEFLYHRNPEIEMVCICYVTEESLIAISAQEGNGYIHFPWRGRMKSCDNN